MKKKITLCLLFLIINSFIFSTSFNLNCGTGFNVIKATDEYKISYIYTSIGSEYKNIYIQTTFYNLIDTQINKLEERYFSNGNGLSSSIGYNFRYEYSKSESCEFLPAIEYRFINSNNTPFIFHNYNSINIKANFLLNKKIKDFSFNFLLCPYYNLYTKINYSEKIDSFEYKINDETIVNPASSKILEDKSLFGYGIDFGISIKYFIN